MYTLIFLRVCPSLAGRPRRKGLIKEKVICRENTANVLFFDLELVLSVLLESYTFEPSGKEIYWNMTPVQTPVVPESDELTPSLPIKMGIVTH